MELNLVNIVLLYGVLLVSLVFHEASHALFALLGGDRTAYLGGQVSLNPAPHIRREPFGTVILPLVALFASGGSMIFGYAHTPIDPNWASRHPKRAALMSIAGPLANFFLVAVAIGILKLLATTGLALPRDYGLTQWMRPSGSDDSNVVYAVIRIATTLVTLNVLLGIFNLIPVPPFDGAGVVEGLFPRATRELYAMIRQQAFTSLLVLFIAWQTMEYWLYPPLRFLYHLL